MGLFKSIKKIATGFSGSDEKESELIEEKKEVLDAKQLKKERNKKIDQTVDEVVDVINDVGEMADDLFDVGIPGVGFLGKTAAKVGIKTAIKGGRAVASVATSAGHFVDKTVLTDRNKELAKKGGQMAVSAATNAADYVGKKVFTDKNKELARKGGQKAASLASNATDYVGKKVFTYKNKALVNKGLKGLKSFLSED